jgi:hypothetical protein
VDSIGARGAAEDGDVGVDIEVVSESAGGPPAAVGLPLL